MAHSSLSSYLKKYHPFSWLVTGHDITYMVFTTVAYFLLAVLIDVVLSFPALRAKLLPDKDVPEPHYEVWDVPCLSLPLPALALPALSWLPVCPVAPITPTSVTLHGRSVYGVPQIDEDVTTEKQRVDSGQAESDMIVRRQLFPGACFAHATTHTCGTPSFPSPPLPSRHLARSTVAPPSSLPPSPVTRLPAPRVL